MEVQDLRPKATSDTATAMKKQMISERQRRSEFIQAEGNKAAMKLRSEGLKIVKTNLVSHLLAGGCHRFCTRLLLLYADATGVFAPFRRWQSCAQHVAQPYSML